MFLPIPAGNQSGLTADLEGDPFVGHALNSATCELYHRYGMFLASLTAALTTMKHCQFGHKCPVRMNDVGEREDGESRDGMIVSVFGAGTESRYGERKRPKESVSRPRRRRRSKVQARTTTRRASSGQRIISSGRRHICLLHEGVGRCKATTGI